jgi:anti-sigma regulatory factor (Ser/Thr protein kinase)
MQPTALITGCRVKGGPVPYDRPIGNVVDLYFEPTHEASAQTRLEACDLLGRAGLAHVVAADVELVIAELTSNAVEQEPGAPIRLRASIGDDGVHITVTNRASEPWPLPHEPGSTGAGAGEPDGSADTGDVAREELAERGWGLGIIRAMSDELWFDHEEGWTSAHAVVPTDRRRP